MTSPLPEDTNGKICGDCGHELDGENCVAGGVHDKPTKAEIEDTNGWERAIRLLALGSDAEERDEIVRIVHAELQAAREEENAKYKPALITSLKAHDGKLYAIIEIPAASQQDFAVFVTTSPTDV